jgi:hypothetical protein
VERYESKIKETEVDKNITLPNLLRKAEEDALAIIYIYMLEPSRVLVDYDAV